MKQNEIDSGEFQVGSQRQQKCTFSQIVAGVSQISNEGIVLKEAAPPRVVGGNIVITVDEVEYTKGVAEFAHSLIGRIIYSKG